MLRPMRPFPSSNRTVKVDPAASSFQLTIDCLDPHRLTQFWALALGYVVEPLPPGFTDWAAYWRDRGVPDAELEGVEGSDSLVDPAGHGPRIWFQIVPETKAVKNRIHFDLDAGGGPGVPLPERKNRVNVRVTELVGQGATRLRILEHDYPDHYAVVMQDPEGNEFCVH